jgi:hypothetical protein
MAKITWLGSTEGYREGETPLDSCVWNGVLFTAGDKVEITDEWMINKARGNRFFRVDEELAKKPEPEQSMPIGLIGPETWTNTPDVATWTTPHPYPAPPLDYPPEDDPDRPKRRGRPPRIRENSDGD